MEHLTLYNCLGSTLSEREKPRLFLHNLLIRSENGLGHFKEQFRCQARKILRKKLFLILCSAVQKLYKLLILSLLITYYSSVYLFIFLFYLSVYLTILQVVGVSYQRVPRLAEG